MQNMGRSLTNQLYIYRILLNMLEFCQLFASIIYFVFYIINRAPLCLKIKQPVVEEPLIAPKEEPPQFNWKLYQVGRRRSLTQLARLGNALIKYGGRCALHYGIPLMMKGFKIISFYMSTAYHLAKYEDDFIVISTYLLCSILGIFVQNYFFSLHLFFLFVSFILY